MATSLHVLRSFLHTLPDKSVDASQIHSRECYLAWLATRNAVDNEAERKKFHRSLTNHLSGVDGRCPFDQHEEEAILRVLRRKERWPCFPDQPIGMNFRAKGFHEKQNTGARASASAAAASPARSPAPMTSRLPQQHADKRPRLSSPRDCLPPDEAALLLKLCNGFAEYSASYAPFGIDVRTSIFGILRFCLAFRDPARMFKFSQRMPMAAQQVEYAQGLCNRVTRSKDPEAAVVVCDWAFGSHGRVLVQNQRSLEWFGEIREGLGLELVHFSSASDLYQLTQTVGAALLKPGIEFQIPRGVFCVAGEADRRMSVSECWLDPESNLLVGVAVPS